MKRLTLVLFLLASVLLAKGQNRLDEIASRWETDRISVDCSCIVNGDVPINFKGTILIQGDCYRMKGNGLEVYCDGSTRWTLDRKAREVYIEAANGMDELMQYYTSITNLEISSIRYTAKSEDLSAFTFSTSDLDSSWIVTDLR